MAGTCSVSDVDGEVLARSATVKAGTGSVGDVVDDHVSFTLPRGPYHHHVITSSLPHAQHALSPFKSDFWRWQKALKESRLHSEQGIASIHVSYIKSQSPLGRF